LEKIVKKEEEKVMLWESHWTDLRFYMQRDCTKKLMQILNDPTHPMTHYFDSNRSGGFFTSKNKCKLL